MKKIFLNLSLILGLLSLAKASEIDILATVTNGALSENSAGVKVLSLDEKKEVIGGYKTFSASWYVNTHITKPLKNNYNANTRPQTNHQSIYSNAFMKTYKPPIYILGGIKLRQ